MSEVTIEVNQQNIQQFFSIAKTTPFVIPEYQREYAWEDDQVNQLFDDILDFTQTKLINNDKTQEKYFLGCVVAYSNEQNEMEIIDGQQRLTTLFLLLRAIYAKLEQMSMCDEVRNFTSLLSPLLWEKDEYTGNINREKIMITSRVITEEKNEVFHNILVTGEVDAIAEDKYSANYRLLQERINQLAQEEPFSFYKYINALIRRVILMPIISGDQDTAMTIFLTLNNRGLQLTDSDIFKAKIYSLLPSADREVFIDLWKNLAEEAKTVNLDIQSLFSYHSFFCRAREGDRNPTRAGIRRYYSENQYSRLSSPTLMEEIWKIVDFWKVVRLKQQLCGESWSSNDRILKIFDILETYPHDFWKNTAISFYLIHRDEEDFEKDFLSFLCKLVVCLIETTLVSSGANLLKSKMFNLNAMVGKTSKPNFEFVEIEDSILREHLIVPKTKIVRILLALLYHAEQDNGFLPSRWEIEHILPKKYDSTYFLPNSIVEINQMIGHIGNLLPIEKKNNIQASNGFFAKKKEIYKKSNFKIVRKFVDNASREWNLDEIKERDSRQIKKLIQILHALYNDASLEFEDAFSSSSSDMSPIVSSQEEANEKELSSRLRDVYLQRLNKDLYIMEPQSDSNDCIEHKNHRKSYGKSAPTAFKVRFMDNTCINEDTATSTLIKCIEKIGPDKVYNLGIITHGEELLSRRPSEKYPQRDRRVMGGYYLRTNTSTSLKIIHLQEISDRLNLNLVISQYVR